MHVVLCSRHRQRILPFPISKRDGMPVIEYSADTLPIYNDMSTSRADVQRTDARPLAKSALPWEIRIRRLLNYKEEVS